MRLHHVLLSTIAIASLTACNHADSDDDAPRAQALSLDSVSKNIPISVDTVHATAAEQYISLTGRVTYDEDLISRVVPFAGGIAVDVRADIGDQVRRGQPLAVVQSAEVMDVSSQAAAARSNVAVAEKSLHAAEILHKSGLMTDRDYEAAVREMERTRSELQRTQDVSGLLGSSSSSNYTVKSPRTGTVVQRAITQGSHFRADDDSPLFTVADLSRVWVLANVYESDINAVREGDSVAIQVIAYPDTTFHGIINRIYSVLDPGNRTMKIKIQVSNPGLLLKPEMFANVVIRRKEHRYLPSVKTTSLIFHNNSHWVLVVGANDKISPRKVHPYREVGDRTYITDGLAEGEHVVASNQLLLFNAIVQ